MEEQIWQIVSAKLNNESLDDSQIRLLENWLNESEENLELYTRLLRFIKAQQAASSVHTDAACRKVMARIGQERKARIFKTGAWIASAAACLLAGVFLLNRYPHNPGPELTPLALGQPLSAGDSTRICLTVGSESAIIDGTDTVDMLVGGLRAKCMGKTLYCTLSEEGITEYATIRVPYGKDYRVTLPDETEVYLNSNSVLSFPTRFGGGKRGVKLQGEAYFKVKKDLTHPFIVETAEIDVKVTGTSFNVKAYDGDEDVYATLVNGAVTVIPHKFPQFEVELLPNEQYAMHLSSGKQVVREVDPYLYIAWTDAMFVFKNRPLDEIFRDLSRWYNFRYEFADAASARMRVSVNMEKTKSAESILRMFTQLNKVAVERKENGVYSIMVKDTETVQAMK